MAAPSLTNAAQVGKAVVDSREEFDKICQSLGIKEFDTNDKIRTLLLKRNEEDAKQKVRPPSSACFGSGRQGQASLRRPAARASAACSVRLGSGDA